MTNPSLIKTLSYPGIEENFLKLTRGISEKPTANVTLNGEGLKCPPLRSGMRQGCLLSSLLFNVVLEDLLGTAGHEKKEKAPGLEKKQQNYLYLQKT